MGVGWLVLLVGARIDCWRSHTVLEGVTDAGIKDFSAALGSSTTITTVELCGKSGWYRWHELGRVLVCMRVCLARTWGLVWCFFVGSA